ncbi:MAG: FAD-dependent oxidoreductase [Dehalococcoidia bacterium]
MTTIVIVGANLAGGRAAETLRREGYDDRIVLVGAEADRPYERPPLSKEFLAGHKPREKVFLRPEHFYSDERIELLLGVRASGLDPAAKVVQLADGRSLGYDKLLVATGSAPRRLKIPGSDLEGVHYLRTVEDSEAIRNGLRPGARLVVVGGGFIGMEVAATARGLGAEVTIVEPLATPLETSLGREIGSQLAEIHRAHGVSLRLGEAVTSFVGAGRVEQVRTSNGLALDCDVVVVGIGVIPEDGWLEGSGIARERGVLTDEFCRTSLPDVWAAGDVTNWWHPVLRERLHVEHFENAQQQAVQAAKSMLGQSDPYAPQLYFWSDQYDRILQMVGHPKADDLMVWRGAPPHEPWAVFYLREGQLVAALAVNMVREFVAARQFMRKGAVVSEQTLADPGVDLRELARSL